MESGRKEARGHRAKEEERKTARNGWCLPIFLFGEEWGGGGGVRGGKSLALSVCSDVLLASRLTGTTEQGPLDGLALSDVGEHFAHPPLHLIQPRSTQNNDFHQPRDIIAPEEIQRLGTHVHTAGGRVVHERLLVAPHELVQRVRRLCRVRMQLLHPAAVVLRSSTRPDDSRITKCETHARACTHRKPWEGRDRPTEVAAATLTCKTPLNSECTACTSRTMASAFIKGAVKNCASLDSASCSASGLTSKKKLVCSHSVNALEKLSVDEEGEGGEA